MRLTAGCCLGRSSGGAVGGAGVQLSACSSLYGVYAGVFVSYYYYLQKTQPPWRPLLVCSSHFEFACTPFEGLLAKEMWNRRRWRLSCLRLGVVWPRGVARTGSGSSCFVRPLETGPSPAVGGRDRRVSRSFGPISLLLKWFPQGSLLASSWFSKVRDPFAADISFGFPQKMGLVPSTRLLALTWPWIRFGFPLPPSHK